MARVPHIAVVDDEAEIRSSIAEYLTMHGFNVSEADGGAALRRLVGRGEQFDLVILDIRMPGEDGLSLARWLREHVKIGVIMLTASGDTVDRITGLEVGADDYVPKPFDLRELLARVRSVLRRVAGMPTKPTMPEQIRFGRFILELASKSLATETGEPVPLTTMEFDLLKAFATHPNRVLSRDQLLDLAHGKGAEPFDRSIDIRVTRLRRKIEEVPDRPEIIKTIRGAGYMFVPDQLAKQT
ncbi:MAG: response regulator [Bauldia sp.]|nr:response regulator [Bauldia sp.]